MVRPNRRSIVQSIPGARRRSNATVNHPSLGYEESRQLHGAVVSNRNSVTNMDEFFAAGLRAEFESAVEHVGTSGMSISESDQRTLFGLYVAPLRLPACVHPALACSGEVSIRYQVAKYGPSGS